MRRFIDVLSIIVIASLTLLSINLYISLKDERKAENEQRVEKVVCDDLEIELLIGGHYEYLGECRFKHLKDYKRRGLLE